MRFQLTNFEWASAIEVVVLALVSLALYVRPHCKAVKLRVRRRPRKLNPSAGWHRDPNRTARPRTTTIARLGYRKPVPDS